MRKMSSVEEIGLLNAIKSGKYGMIGNGSSRAVFSIGKNKIAKVVLDSDSIAQNEEEVRIYLEESHKFPCKVFAKVFAYGKFLLIMEKVKPISDQDGCYSNYLNDKYGDEVNDIAECAEEILGETGDNLQIGVDSGGNCVLYDYGYNRDYPSCGNGYCFETRGQFNKHIKKLIYYVEHELDSRDI